MKAPLRSAPDPWGRLLLSSRPGRIGGFCRGAVVTLHVDPEALRTFAAFVADTADAVDDWDVGEPYAVSQSALPGTEFAAVCARAFTATDQALGNVCSRLREIVDITDGAKNDYAVAETDFVAALSAMDPHE